MRLFASLVVLVLVACSYSPKEIPFEQKCNAFSYRASERHWVKVPYDLDNDVQFEIWANERLPKVKTDIPREYRGLNFIDPISGLTIQTAEISNLPWWKFVHAKGCGVWRVEPPSREAHLHGASAPALAPNTIADRRALHHFQKQ